VLLVQHVLVDEDRAQVLARGHRVTEGAYQTYLQAVRSFCAASDCPSADGRAANSLLISPHLCCALSTCARCQRAGPHFGSFATASGNSAVALARSPLSRHATPRSAMRAAVGDSWRALSSAAIA